MVLCTELGFSLQTALSTLPVLLTLKPGKPIQEQKAAYEAEFDQLLRKKSTGMSKTFLAQQSLAEQILSLAPRSCAATCKTHSQMTTKRLQFQLIPQCCDLSSSGCDKLAQRLLLHALSGAW